MDGWKYGESNHAPLGSTNGVVAVRSRGWGGGSGVKCFVSRSMETKHDWPSE